MARTSAKAKKPPKKENENNTTLNNGSKEDIDGNKSETKINKDPIEMHNKENDDLNYEIEKIIDCQESGGKTQYLVRWKGYKKVNDTWENESALKSCSESLAAFKQRNTQSSSKNKREKGTNTVKNKSFKKGIEKSQRHHYLSERERSQKKRKNKLSKRAKSPSRKKIKSDTKPSAKTRMDEETSDESDIESTDGINYDVEKIVEMRIKKNGSREFLIRWKGYNPGQDTWEPEGHLNCQDMIRRFIEDISKVKDQTDTEIKELKNAKTVVPASKDSDQ